MPFSYLFKHNLSTHTYTYILHQKLYLVTIQYNCRIFERMTFQFNFVFVLLTTGAIGEFDWYGHSAVPLTGA